MKKIVLPFAIVACIILLVVGYWYVTERSSGGGQSETGQDPLIEAATLAIKGINLMQGEKGFEYWRLKADWAAMHHEGDVIDVREPRVRYTLGEGADEDYVYAVSQFGKISDQQQVLTMWDDVVLTRGEDTIVGPEMTYRTDERKVRFPKGGTIMRPTMEGTFGSLVWDMDANRIEGGEGVDITFEAKNPVPRPESPHEPASGSGPETQRSEDHA